ncbi:MAG: hypothetical protein V4850_04280 [Myxococcota bacterium]
MDRTELRRKALLAASSVVLAATLAACPTPSADTADTASVDTAADTDTVDTDTDGSPDCTAIDMGDSEAWGACCTERAEWCAEAHGEGTDAANYCTYGPDYDGSTGCVPWGPPVPPRFRGALAA